MDPETTNKYVQSFLNNIPTSKSPEHKNTPYFPKNFTWKGRYIVPDLIDPDTDKRIDVPFTWVGRNGDIQMIAGGYKYPIYFTNFIYKGNLYTYTYKWPGLQPPFLPPLESCEPLFKFTRKDLNNFLTTGAFAGQVKIKDKCGHWIKNNHFRVPLVFPPGAPSGFFPRLPILMGDFFVDSDDSSKIRKVYHFGLHNLYDPNLDEWIEIHEFSDKPGKLKLPSCVDC